jgi:Late embryogenesis abundant protein
LRHYRLGWLGLLALVCACTPLGAWVYDDPSFTLHSVEVRRAGQADSLDLVFVGCNRNDYDLTGEKFTTRLAVAGETLGEVERDQPVFLGTRDTSVFTVTVPVPSHALETGGPGRRFELSGGSEVHTPMGTRKVAFRMRGRVQYKDETLRWSGDAGPMCRPGLSKLPPVFDRRTRLAPGDNGPPPAPPPQTSPNPRSLLEGRPSQ